MKRNTCIYPYIMSSQSTGHSGISMIETETSISNWSKNRLIKKRCRYINLLHTVNLLMTFFRSLRDIPYIFLFMHIFNVHNWHNTFPAIEITEFCNILLFQSEKTKLISTLHIFKERRGKRGEEREADARSAVFVFSALRQRWFLTARSSTSHLTFIWWFFNPFARKFYSLPHRGRLHLRRWFREMPSDNSTVVCVCVRCNFAVNSELYSCSVHGV